MTILKTQCDKIQCHNHSFCVPTKPQQNIPSKYKYFHEIIKYFTQAYNLSWHKSAAADSWM